MDLLVQVVLELLVVSALSLGLIVFGMPTTLVRSVDRADKASGMDEAPPAPAEPGLPTALAADPKRTRTVL